MTLPASGELGFDDINVELGRASNTAMTINDTNVRALAQKASGLISISDFYGKENKFNFSQTIAVNTTNYNLRNAAIAAGWNQTTVLAATITINSGVYVSSNSTSVSAFDRSGSFPAGSTLTIINNGNIVGMGGSGSQGTGTNGASANGSPGGPALSAGLAATITNNGTIAGGGGGGGGGGATQTSYDKQSQVWGGGGGGGGRSSAAANSGGGAAGGTNTSPLSNSFQSLGGNGGTVSGAGTGGAGAYSTIFADRGGNGGNGGAWGSSGGTGEAPTVSGGTLLYSGKAGGSGGAAVNGNANITWLATGTRLGAINA